MVTTNSAELAERVKMLRQHGMRRRYHHDELGWNTRMDGFQGAILRVKLPTSRLEQARREVAARYHALFRLPGWRRPDPIRSMVWCCRARSPAASTSGTST